MRRFSHLLVTALGVALVATTLTVGAASEEHPLPGTASLKTTHGFDALVKRLEAAIERHEMGLVAKASASRGAAARGVTIPGNAVLMVFRNDYAVRMLQASVAAGIEAPLRIYVTENSDGSATITYRMPSAVFAPYQDGALDALARELDAVLRNIVRDAAQGG